MRLHKKLKPFYFISLGVLIAAFCVITFIGYKYSHVISYHHLKTISISSNQKYLVQHTVTVALQMSKTKNPRSYFHLQKGLINDIQEIKKENEKLNKINHSKNWLFQEAQKLTNLYTQKPYQINEKLKIFLAKAESLAGKERVSENDPDLIYLVQNSPPLIQALDQATKVYRALTNKDYADLYHLIFIISFFSLGIILFIAFALVYPTVKLLAKTDQSLEIKTSESETLFNLSHDGIFKCSPSGKIIEANCQAVNILGYLKEELIGSQISDHFREINKNKNLLGMSNESFETTAIKKNGEHLPVRILITIDEHYISVFMEDLTLMKQAEYDILQHTKKLKEFQERYQLATEGSAVGIWDWKIDKDEIYFSSICYQILGYSSDEIFRDFNSFAALVHPDDREMVEKAVDDHLKGKGAYDVEYRIKHKDGRYIWIHARGQAIWDKEGKPYRMAGSLDDITKEKQTIEELKTSQLRYKLATEGSSVGIWDWDIPNDYLWASPLCYEIVGMKQGEVIPNFENFLKFIHPEDRDRFMRIREAHLYEHKEYNLKYRFRHKLGHYLWIHSKGQAFWDKEGSPIRMAGSMSDITTLVNNEKMLKDYKTSLETLLVITTSKEFGFKEKVDKLIDYCNKQFQTACGIFASVEKENIVIQTSVPSNENFPKNKQFQAKNSLIAPVLGKSNIISIIDVNQSQWKKSSFFNELNIKSYLAAPIIVDDEFYGALCFFTLRTSHEFTDWKRTFIKMFSTWMGMEISRKRYQENLKEEKIKADQANIAKSEFLQNMSHEIRTPMNGIVGMTYLLMDTGLNDLQTKYAGGVLTSANNLLSIINDILDMTRIERGKLAFFKSSFNLKNVIEDMATQSASLIQNKDVDFLLRYDPKAPGYFIEDEKRIEQILQNLVSNAIKFTSSGYIFINVDLISQKEDKFTLKFSVEDTGMGIPEDKKEVIFEKFQQIDTSSTRKFGGLGIGLAICKDLIAMMNGEIGLISKPDVGSTFWFTLPLEIDKEKKLKPPPCYPGKKVAILTESKIQKQNIKEVFEIAEIETHFFSTLDNFLKEETTENFDVFIVDKNEDTELPSEIRLAKTPSILIKDPFSHAGEGWSKILIKPLFAESLLKKIEPFFKENLKTEKPETHENKVKKNPSILVVEDDLVNQQVIHDLLENYGYKVTVAGSGREGIVKFKERTFDLILMDCVMPEMDGYQTTGIIRELEKENHSKKTPIIAVTALAGKGENLKCLKAGMDDYISKPIDKPEFEKILKKWLPKN